MDKTKRERHHKMIKDLIRDLGIEATDDYFQDELKVMVKSIATLREKNKELKVLSLEATNSDEIMHLKYDIEDHEKLLKSLLIKLETINEGYRCFLEQTGQK